MRDQDDHENRGNDRRPHRVPEDGKAEIVGGEIVRMGPTGDMSARAGLKIAMSLSRMEHKANGRAYPDNVGFMVHLPHRKSFGPDAASYTGRPTGMKFLEGAPVFAVEVRSENDHGPKVEAEIAQKRRDYFAAGTQVVWDVDLLSEEVVRVYRATDPDRPTIHRRHETAEAEPAVLGWEMAVDELFR